MHAGEGFLDASKTGLSVLTEVRPCLPTHNILAKFEGETTN